MLAISHSSGHAVVWYGEAAWAALIGAVGFLANLAVVTGYSPQRRITYRRASCDSLGRPDIPGVQVSYHGSVLSDPHVLRLELKYRGNGDIRPSAFEDGLPLRIIVGAPVVGVDVRFKREEGPRLGVVASGSELRIGPGRVRRGQVMWLSAVVDGAVGELSADDPPTDVRVREAFDLKHRLAARSDLSLRLVVTWGIVVFIIYYLVSDPGGAANVVHSALNGLGSVGRSLSGFVNSL